MKAERRTHPRSRPMPATLEPDLPDHLRALTFCALTGTLRAPIGARLAEIYLAAARALIDAARVIHEVDRRP